MTCPKCRTENRDGAKFCKHCAALMLAKCVNCGAAIQPESKFCDECGVPVASAASPARSISESTPLVRLLPEQPAAAANDGERKTVTALFADIKGSTELEQD